MFRILSGSNNKFTINTIIKSLPFLLRRKQTQVHYNNVLNDIEILVSWHSYLIKKSY